MKTDFLPFVGDIIHNPKAPALVSIFAAGTGVSTLFNWISQGIGITASAAALVLAIVMIRKSMLEHKKLKLEIDGIQRRESERQDAIEDRKSCGKKLRRSSDK